MARDDAGDIVDDEAKAEVFQNKLLYEHQRAYVAQLKQLGYEEFDINIMIEKGIASLDKALAVEQLSDLHKDAKQRMLKDKQRRQLKREKLNMEK